MPRASTPKLTEKLEELAPSETDVEYGTFDAHEALREIAVPGGDVVGRTAEVRVERVRAVPRVDAGSGNTRHDLGELHEERLHLLLLLRELDLQVVELLENPRVVRLREHVRRLGHQRDSAHDPM